MKLRVLVQKDKRENVLHDLATHEIVYCEDADFVLYEINHEHDYLLVKEKEEFMRILTEDILYIEGLGAKVLAHGKEGIFVCRETMYTLEAALYEKGFLRIHKAYIVNKHAIQRIRTSLNMKFILQLKNGESIEVSRSYYYRFKEEMGF